MSNSTAFSMLLRETCVPHKISFSDFQSLYMFIISFAGSLCPLLRTIPPFCSPFRGSFLLHTMKIIKCKSRWNVVKCLSILWYYDIMSIMNGSLPYLLRWCFSVEPPTTKSTYIHKHLRIFLSLMVLFCMGFLSPSFGKLKPEKYHRNVSRCCRHICK